MKSIRVMIDPGLLAVLDATDEVRREGRSAVLRRAISECLERRRSDPPELLEEALHKDQLALLSRACTPDEEKPLAIPRDVVLAASRGALIVDVREQRARRRPR
jgi:hypothetical protein